MPEFSLIEKYFKPLTSGHKAARGLNDDAAKFALKAGEELVISKDMFIEDVHFLATDGAYKIASKLLLRNLSDLAASGAKPLYYMLGFGKTKKCDEKFFAEFVRGLKDVQKKFGLTLIGGDTTNSEKIFLSVTIFGLIKKDKILSRDSAKNGDLIFVSGNIGDAYQGLQIKLAKQIQKLSKNEKTYFLQRHFFPNPQIDLAIKLLQKNLSTCAIDISDGLLADLRHVCEASKLSAEINLAQIPFYQKNLTTAQKLDLLSGGDDYELLFCANPHDEKKILQLAKSLKIKLTCIGIFKKPANKKAEISLRGSDNKKIPIKKFGYEHF